jgi:hypothetical protein
MVRGPEMPNLAFLDLATFREPAPRTSVNPELRAVPVENLIRLAGGGESGESSA